MPSAQFIADNPGLDPYTAFLAIKYSDGSFALLGTGGYVAVGGTDGESDPAFIVSPVPVAEETKFLDFDPAPTTLQLPVHEIVYSVESVDNIERFCINGIPLVDIGEASEEVLLQYTGYPTYDDLD